MLKPQPFANAFAASTALIYLCFFVLKIAAPPFFELVLNSQFLGANIASQVPNSGFTGFLGSLIAISVVSWIAGYLIAYFYNKQSKNKAETG